MDALTVAFENLYAYVYSPIYPIPKILQYIRQFHCQIILMAPQWPRWHWYTRLLQFWFLHLSKYQFETTCYINQNTDLSPTTSDVQSECLVVIDRGIKSKGVLEKAHVGILKKRHTQNYSSKFKKFNSWCNSIEIDPYLASLNEIAHLLAFLFDEGLQYRTIADQCYQFCFHQLLLFQ